MSAKLANFRVAARDEVLATASGTVSVAGPLAAPKVTAALTIDRADISLPDSLPPSVVVLHVTEIGGSTRKPAATARGPAAPTFRRRSTSRSRMPGQVFVRGHGLNSDWRGRLEITGTSAAPHISGVLLASRGSVDLLGKSFRLTRGAITFDGGAKLDPALDIVAEANASDITAQVIITGYASAPKITLASTPPVPQDEILSRILFNQGVGQITAGQGVQLAHGRRHARRRRSGRARPAARQARPRLARTRPGAGRGGEPDPEPERGQPRRPRAPPRSAPANI